MCLDFLFFPFRLIMTQGRLKLPKRARPLHIWCQPTRCTVCHIPHSRHHHTWDPGPSLSLICRVTQATPHATLCHRPSANPQCCPALVPPLLPPSRSAHRFTPTSSSPCTRARSSTSPFACSRSSPSQSSLTRWGYRPLFTPHLQGSRYRNKPRNIRLGESNEVSALGFCFNFSDLSPSGFFPPPVRVPEDHCRFPVSRSSWLWFRSWSGSDPWVGWRVLQSGVWQPLQVSVYIRCDWCELMIHFRGIF